jgi:glycosyltransferase involved in cell wall biosynthesis
MASVPNGSPFITIITSSLNAVDHIELSIRSIIKQTYNNFEYIIIDGGSNDGTVDIIKKHEKHITHWQSEPDSGIYDAWNKALKIAKGEWIIFLGADDQLLPETIENYVKFIRTNSDKEYDYISSRVKRIRPDGSIEGIVGKPWVWNQFKYKMTTAHPGSFHSKNLFSKYGYYNTDYKIVSDYEMLLRPGKDLKAGYIDTITVLMSTGTTLQKKDAYRECNDMLKHSDHLKYYEYYTVIFQMIAML